MKRFSNVHNFNVGKMTEDEELEVKVINAIEALYKRKDFPITDTKIRKNVGVNYQVKFRKKKGKLTQILKGLERVGAIDWDDEFGWTIS